MQIPPAEELTGIVPLNPYLCFRFLRGHPDEGKRMLKCSLEFGADWF